MNRRRKTSGKRTHSSPEIVAYWQNRIGECLCRMGNLRGIIHKVFAARKYDGVRVLVAWDSQRDGNPVFRYHDILDIDTY